MARGLLSYFIALSVLVGLWFPFPPEYIDPTEECYPLSNNPYEKTAIVLKNKYLIIRNLPKSDEFNYILLKLSDDTAALPAKKSRNARKEAYDVRFNLRDVPDGNYYVEIYTAPEKYTAYRSYINKQTLRIQVDGSHIGFIEPATLTYNKKVFSENTYDAAPSEYLTPSAKIQSDHPDIIELAKSITARSPTDYDKARDIHDWVCGNIWYDYDALYSGANNDESALEALNSRKGVCIGYASLTAALLRAAGIPAKLEAGYTLNASARESRIEELTAGNKSNHVWNEAYVDGRWIIIDTSYDSGNTYKNKEYSAGTGMKNRKYFDITVEFLSADRLITPEEFNPVKSR